MTVRARRLRQEQTEEEKQLWRALKAGRFAGFKFRRQHPMGGYYLDFYCPMARLGIELDGSQHGFPKGMAHDETRATLVASKGIGLLRFWNRQWRENRDGVLLEIWLALQRRTGSRQIQRKQENNRYWPPHTEELNQEASSPPALSSTDVEERERFGSEFI